MAMAVVLSLFAGRLVQLQGLNSKTFQAKAAEQRVRPEVLPAKRGSILDVNGNELAVDGRRAGDLSRPQRGQARAGAS